MANNESIIIGAGLAGLTAAIKLSREGRQVTVLEKGRRIGGSVAYNPSPHGTPMDPRAMARYTGIDLEPGMVRLPGGIVSLWGKRYEVKFPSNMAAWMIERGARRSSLDHYLYRIALGEGVRFEFDQAVISERQLRDLPPGTIMATGLHVDGFEAAGVPYRLLHGYFAKCQVPPMEPSVTLYFDDYTDDYAFTCAVNGIALGLVFNRRRPVARWEMEKFAEQAALEDGYPFKRFQPLEVGGLPVARLSNPRLFQGSLILAGTLAGMIDPILCFGMHGALLSGVIAARAIGDPEGAGKEFRRMNRNFYPLMAAKRAVDLLPHGTLMKHPARMAFRLMPLYARPLMGQAFKINVPGYGRI